MGHRSGKYSTLERRTAVLMYENGFTLKEIAEILYRKNPAAIRQGIQRWRQEIITVATSNFSRILPSGKVVGIE